jgi:hypothetical protein
MAKLTTKMLMVRIIRDCRNANLDYELPLNRARALYNERKLVWDSTNKAYSHRHDDLDSQALTPKFT